MKNIKSVFIINPPRPSVMKAFLYLTTNPEDIRDSQIYLVTISDSTTTIDKNYRRINK